MQGSGVGSSGVHHDGMAHGVVFFQNSHHLGHLALLLADGDIDADKVAAALVNNGVQGDRGLTGGAVADDKLPLPSTYGNHGVNGLYAGLNRGVYRLAHHHVGSHLLHGPSATGIDRALAIQWPSQGVHHAANQGIAYGNLDNLTGGTDLVAFLDGVGVTQNGGADQVGLQVEGQTQDVVAEVQQFVGADTLQALDAGDTITHLDHGAHVNHAQVAAKFLNLAPD